MAHFLVAVFSKSGLADIHNLLAPFREHTGMDWYEIGGRWTGMLVMKDGFEGQRGAPDLGRELTENYDSALASEVDFEIMRQDLHARMLPYELALARGHFRIEQFPAEADYIDRATLFTTFAAILPNSEWHTPRELEKTPEPLKRATAERKWVRDYYDRFVKPAIENSWYITVVDCHI